MALWACGDEPLSPTIAFRLHGPPPLDFSGRCAEPAEPVPLWPRPASVRLSFRIAGGGPLVCDAVVSDAGRVVAVPAGDDRVEVFAEVYDEGGALAGVGAAREVDLTAAGEVRLFVTPRGAFGCTLRRGTAPRALHAAVPLPGGGALLIGGLDRIVGADGYASASVDLYDGGSFRPVPAAGLSARALHGATVLGVDPDGSVRIAVFGGVTVRGDPAASPVLTAPDDGAPLPIVPAPAAVGAPTEILRYDPASSQIAVEAAGPGEVTPRLMAAVTAAGAAPPVIAGGWADAARTTPALTVEGLDPDTGLAAFSADLVTPRYGGTATPVAPGRVVLWGGHLDAPPAQRGALAGEMLLLGTPPVSSTLAFADPDAPPASRALHAAAAVAGGGLVVAGGVALGDGGAAGLVEPFAERIDAGAVTTHAPLPVDGGAAPALLPAAVSLADGGALIAGGGGLCPDSGPLACPVRAAYRYDATSGELARAGDLQVARWGAVAVALPSGDVLVTGGVALDADGAPTPVADAEVTHAGSADLDPIADLGLDRPPAVAVQPCPEPR
ncbi:MAG: hypothetical protein D6689_08860, partial [Deltaproteobacteria bacterium]